LRAQQESSTVVYSDHERTPKVQTATAYLETLNPEQRLAVEHGAAGGLAAPPLLVIAGAERYTEEVRATRRWLREAPSRY
jgi:DNA helicase-2/ATP-dependent DNA helicase PcrA